MKIKYESYDGKLFDSEKECERYEEENVLPPMWNLEGNPTTDLEDAFLVHFISIEEIKNFIRCCADIGITSGGLTTNGIDDIDSDIKPGYYYFNTYYEEWVRIPDAFVNKNLKR